MRAKECFFLVVLLNLTVAISVGAQESISETDLSVIEAKGRNGRIAFNQFLYVKIDNLQTWLKKPGNDASRFQLVIGGHPIKGLPPPFVTENALGFHLMRTPESKNEWKNILKRVLDDPNDKVGITVRYEDAHIVKKYVAIELTPNK